QIHEVIRPDDPERVFAPGGTMEALLAARQAGKIRYIGFTGHKDPEIHLKMLDMGFSWDTVQMPLNCVDAHHRSFEAKVLPVLVKRGIGVLGMKPLASGTAVQEGVATAEECLRYALSLPTSVVITGCDSMPIVEQAIRVWHSFTPMFAAALDGLRAWPAPRNPQGSMECLKLCLHLRGCTDDGAVLVVRIERIGVGDCLGLGGGVGEGDHLTLPVDQDVLDVPPHLLAVLRQHSDPALKLVRLRGGCVPP